AAHVLLAARRAAALESNREAYAHYRRALGFVDRLDSRKQAAVLEEYAAVAHFAGHLDHALEGIRRAIRLNHEACDDAARGRCVRLLSRLLWFAGRGEPAHATPPPP